MAKACFPLGEFVRAHRIKSKLIGRRQPPQNHGWTITYNMYHELRTESLGITCLRSLPIRDQLGTWNDNHPRLEMKPVLQQTFAFTWPKVGLASPLVKTRDNVSVLLMYEKINHKIVEQKLGFTLHSLILCNKTFKSNVLMSWPYKTHNQNFNIQKYTNFFVV
jgi:hypothetical protein